VVLASDWALGIILLYNIVIISFVPYSLFPVSIGQLVDEFWKNYCLGTRKCGAECIGTIYIPQLIILVQFAAWAYRQRLVHMLQQ
jgi:hypothetical protein